MLLLVVSSLHLGIILLHDVTNIWQVGEVISVAKGQSQGINPISSIGGRRWSMQLAIPNLLLFSSTPSQGVSKWFSVWWQSPVWQFRPLSIQKEQVKVKVMSYKMGIDSAQF